MNLFLKILIWIAVFGVLAVLAGWLGARLGAKAARKYPSLAMSLIIIGSFFKIDPQPPPRSERVLKDEEAAGDPPQV